MSLRREHELEGRRKGRNNGVGLMLGGFVVLIMAITFVKITQTDFSKAPVNTGTQGATD